MASFDSTKTSLKDILQQVHEGKIQLPDFQRGWIWDDNRIKGLIASVIKSFPIGAIMLLETGNPQVRFKPNPIEGVIDPLYTNPEYLVLDGQQRITSLYQTVITNRIVTTRNEKNYEIKRWYYIDMRMALDPGIDLEEAIISVNEQKQITKNIGRDIELDLSEEDFEYERLMYPVCMLDEYSVWRSKYNKYWNYDPQKIQFWDEFEARIINGYNGYMLPVIVMKKDNSKEAVCQVFEKVNTGGVVLTVFELLTATYAAEEFDLKHHSKQIKAGFAPYRVLENVQNTDIIQAVTLLARYRNRLAWMRNNQLSDDAPPVSCKRKDMLSLSLNEFQKSADDIAKGYIKAARILAENNIFSARDLPYNTQLIPMAAILAELNDSLDTAGQKQKLMRWFWCGVFGELYGAANETRYALDLPQVIDWIKQDGPEPKTIYDANFNPSRLYTLRTRNSAAYKGIYALMLNSGLRDWLSNAKIDLHNYFSERIDIHHIFPVVWCEKNSIPNDQYNSIINKTPLSGGTNRFISGDAPSRYLERLERRIGINGDEFEQILSTHLLDIHYLRNDDFAGFMASRKEMLLRMIEAATGKPIPRGDEYQEEGIYVEDDNDGAEEE